MISSPGTCFLLSYDVNFPVGNGRSSAPNRLVRVASVLSGRRGRAERQSELCDAGPDSGNVHPIGELPAAVGAAAEPQSASAGVHPALHMRLRQLPSQGVLSQQRPAAGAGGAAAAATRPADHTHPASGQPETAAATATRSLLQSSRTVRPQRQLDHHSHRRRRRVGPRSVTPLNLS